VRVDIANIVDSKSSASVLKVSPTSKKSLLNSCLCFKSHNHTYVNCILDHDWLKVVVKSQILLGHPGVYLRFKVNREKLRHYNCSEHSSERSK